MSTQAIPVKIPRIAQTWQPKPFPVTALKFIDACNNPDSTAKDLSQIISLDPSLAASILKMANSSSVGCGQKVKSIDHAIVLLGMKSLKKFGILYGSTKLFQDGSPDVKQARENVYQHTLTVSCWCKHLAKPVPQQTPEEMFLLGMFHDIGKLMYLDHVPVHYAKVLASKLEDKLPTLEQHVFGLDHAELGAQCLIEWKLPETWADVVRHHHEPENQQLDQDCAIKVQLLSCANYLAWYETEIDLSSEDFRKHIENKFPLVQKYLQSADFVSLKEKVLEECNEYLALSKS